MRLLRIVLGATAVALALGIGAAAISTYLEHRRAPAHPPTPAEGCQDGDVVPGIDVSYYQETIDWAKVSDAGIKFAFVRVSDGLTVADPMFARNWREAQRAGIARGAYQYFRPDQDVLAQAELMIAAVRADRGELPPVIDVETDGGLRPTELAARVRAWIDRVRDRLGVEPIVYASPDFWRDNVGGADVGQPLWIAHYTTRCPTIPQPWTRWEFWQHSQTGRVAGIAGPVDLDLGMTSALPGPLAHADQPGVGSGHGVVARLGR